MPEGSTSGSELSLIAEKQSALTESDWQWLARWLAEVLGVSIRIIISRDPRVAGIGAAQPALYYGGREFLRRAGGGLSDGVIGVANDADDWLVRACRWLHRDEDRGDVSRSAILDREIRDLGIQLDRRFSALSRAPYWPARHPCAVVLTHDVDAVDRWSRAHVWHLARHIPERFPREGLRTVARLPWAAVRGVWDMSHLDRRLEHCIAIEKQAAVRATYFFFSPETRYRSAFDAWYTSETVIGGRRTVRTLWEDLVLHDFEVGLHLSIGAHDDPTAITAEWNAMQTSVPTLTTCRSHYLKRKRDVTETALAALGARVELNLVATGFSRGSGLPFVFVEGERVLYRVPTVLVDAELEAEGAEGAVQQRTWDVWQSVLDETRRNGSLAVVLLHPENPGANEMVERVIAWGKARDAWMPTATELIDHWEARAVRHQLRGRVA